MHIRDFLLSHLQHCWSLTSWKSLISKKRTTISSPNPKMDGMPSTLNLHTFSGPHQKQSIIRHHIFLLHLHAFHQAKINPMAALFPSTPCAVLHVNLQLLPFASRKHFNLHFLPTCTLHVPLLIDKIRQCRNPTARSSSICSRSSYNWHDSTPITSRVRHRTLYNMRHVHGLVGIPHCFLWFEFVGKFLFKGIFSKHNPWITWRSYTLSCRRRMNWGRIYWVAWGYLPIASSTSTCWRSRPSCATIRWKQRRLWGMMRILDIIVLGMKILSLTSSEFTSFPVTSFPAVISCLRVDEFDECTRSQNILQDWRQRAMIACELKNLFREVKL
jgi:hypothetical protein